MTIKSQWRYAKIITLSCFLLSLALTGCTDKTKTEPEITSESTDQAENPNDLDASIAQYEAKWADQTETEADYLALAALYQQNGLIRKERDLLEQCYRLYGNADAFQTLQNITVNLEEESQELRDRVNILVQDLITSEFQTEAAADLIDTTWMPHMMPKLMQGRRIYYQNFDEGVTKLVLEVGYDPSGTAYTNLWHIEKGTDLSAIFYTQDSVQLLTTGLQDGKYQGEFQSYLAVASTGDIYHETGTFLDGILTGNYTAEVHFGTQSADLFALYSSRETIDKVLYLGLFNENGTTTQSQDTDKEITYLRGNAEENNIIYAYTEDGESFLSLALPAEEQPQHYIFTAETSLNLPTYLQVTPYTPKTNQPSNSDQIKIRIYDSNIEWNNGDKWIIIGSVEDFAAKDPFLTYAEAGYPPNYTPDQPQDSAQLSTPYQNRGAGTLTTPSTTKPSKPKPTTPSTPGAGDNTGGSSGGNNTGGGNTGGSGDTGGGGGNSGGGNNSGGNTGGGNDNSGGGNTGGGNDNSGGGNTGGGDDNTGGGNTGGGGGNTEEPEFTPDDLV
jgi:hypothetical protein